MAHAAILWKQHRGGWWGQVVGVLSREGSGWKWLDGRTKAGTDSPQSRGGDTTALNYSSHKADHGGGRGSRHTMLRSSCTSTPVNGYHLQGVRRHPSLPVYVYAVMLRVTPGFCCLGYPAKKNKNLCKSLMCQKKKRKKFELKRKTASLFWKYIQKERLFRAGPQASCG